MSIPNRKAIKPVLLDVIEGLGGTAKPSDVYELVAQRLQVNAEDRQEKVSRNRSRFEIEVQFARQELKEEGLLVGLEYGIWKLTDKGREVARANPVPGTAGSEHTAAAQEKDCHKRWSGKESEWHKSTVNRVSADPSLAGVIPKLVRRRWKNSCMSDDNSPLWHRLRSRKRPDVVFELQSGEIILVEVEPHATYLDGIAQLAGDYKTSMLVDRLAKVAISAVLVVDTCADEVRGTVRDLLDHHEISVVVA